MKKLFLTSITALFLTTGTTRHVFSGTTSTVALYFTLTQNCDPRPANEMQITKEPEHGTVELLIGEEATVNLAKEHDRSHCNGKK